MKKGYRADALHGDLSWSQRDRVMKRFKLSICRFLSQPMAARGIDAQDDPRLLFNLPNDNAYYTHRSGRTARAGRRAFPSPSSAGAKRPSSVGWKTPGH